LLTYKIAIQAPAKTPQAHPHDRALLRPLATLGKPKASDASVSFLRRTEYISSTTPKSRPSDVFLRPSSGNTFKRPEKRKSPEPDKDSPAYIRRKIDKSFDVAQQQLKDRSRIKHPSKRNLKVVDAHPMLPDLDAFPDSGAYVTVKFTHNPVPISDQYDTRLLCGVFKPIERTEAEEQAFDAAMEAYERDPKHNPKPNNMMNYEFFLADTAQNGERFRRRFDVDNPECNSDDLYPKDSSGESTSCFQFQRVRAYETAQETELDHESKYSDEIIMAYSDGERRQKAVYYYPVMQRTTIRSQRSKNIARKIGIKPDQEQLIDQLDVTVDDPHDELREHMLRYKDNPLGFLEDEEEEEVVDEGGPAARESNGGAGSPPANGSRARSVGSEDDVDAEGDEEE